MAVSCRHHHEPDRDHREYTARFPSTQREHEDDDPDEQHVGQREGNIETRLQDARVTRHETGGEQRRGSQTADREHSGDAVDPHTGAKPGHAPAPE